MGPIEFIEAAAKGVAKFAGKHAVLTAAAVTAAGGASYVAYQNYNETDRAVNGGVVKQDVAVKDKRGDLSLKMQGLKEVPKANEPAKSDTKSGNGDALKGLKEALDAAKDADIKAEAAKAVEQTPAQPELPPEKPYIPETAAADAVDASANVLDGNDSAAFRPARFASSGSSSAASERSNAGKATAGRNATKAVSGTNASAKSATAAGSGVKSAAAAFETASSGKTEIAKTGGDKGGETGNKGGDGSATETGKGTLSDNNNSSESKGETAKFSNNSGETGSETGNVATTPTSVENTVSTVAKTTEPKPELSAEAEAKQRRLREEKRNGLRQYYLQVLRNAFEKETDCEVDEVVAPSNRRRAGITSTDVMKFATEPAMRVKKVMLYVDNDATTSDLITLLKDLGARTESKRNPNLSFLLQNGRRFLDGSETIEGISLYPDKTGSVLVIFANTPVAPSDKKKPDAGETNGETIGETAKETESDLTKAGGGATGSGGATTSSTTAPTGGTAAIEPPDWMQTLWDNAAEETSIKRVGENIHSLMPLMQRRNSFDGTNVPRFVLNFRLKETRSQAGSYILSLASSPLVTPPVSPRNSTPSSLHPSRKNSFDGSLPDLFDGLGATGACETDPKDRLKEIQRKAAVTKIQNAWRKRLKNKGENNNLVELMRVFLQMQKGDFTLDGEKSAFVLEHAEDLLNRDFFVNHAGHTITLNVSNGNTDALEAILEERGLELTDNEDGTLSFTAAFALPDFDCGRLPTIWLNKNTDENEFKQLKNVRFIYTPEPKDCPNEVWEVFKDDYNSDNDLILNAVCYAGKDSLKQSHAIALEFGDWVPKAVTQWTSKALCVQNTAVTANNGITVTRDDEGIGALLQFNISDENVKAANAWFVCEYEVGEEDQKEKHRIAVHLFFAEEQPV